MRKRERPRSSVARSAFELQLSQHQHPSFSKSRRTADQKTSRFAPSPSDRTLFLRPLSLPTMSDEAGGGPTSLGSAPKLELDDNTTLGFIRWFRSLTQVPRPVSDLPPPP